MKNKVLVTGGAGYIGSHTCVELLNSGYDVIAIDNLCNSSEESLKRVEKITGKKITFYNFNLLEDNKLAEVFEKEVPNAVIHFAALKAVGESCKIPLEYYNNNIRCLLNVLKYMDKYNCKNFVFSSSATVYGDQKQVPIPETASRTATNPYGRTKLMAEEILEDLYKSDNSWNIFLLRYFNPIGAHESGEIGESPDGIPNNLVPYIAKVAHGELESLPVYGNDYDTPDGTGIRDYIHVSDLASGHVKALETIADNKGIVTYNLGTGTGYSVMEMIKAFSKASGREIPVRIMERRSGDIAICYADSTKAKEELNWEATRDLIKMCEDTWRWQKQNPKGYIK